MAIFNVYEAKTHLSRLLDRVAEGRAFIERSHRRSPGLVTGRSPAT